MNTKKITYKVGMIVEHPNRPEWGPGKVVAVGPDHVHVIFRDQLEPQAKAILPALMPLSVAEMQVDEVLDQLPDPTCDGDRWVLPKNYQKSLKGSPAQVKPVKKRALRGRR